MVRTYVYEINRLAAMIANATVPIAQEDRRKLRFACSLSRAAKQIVIHTAAK